MTPSKAAKDKKLKTIEDLTYEQAFTELETIVTALENEKKSLEESMVLFERGQMLVQYCARLLDQAELKVQQLTGESLADLNPPA
jgi:exodeoxyribonuclease VII small subunit